MSKQQVLTLVMVLGVLGALGGSTSAQDRKLDEVLRLRDQEIDLIGRSLPSSALQALEGRIQQWVTLKKGSSWQALGAGQHLMVPEASLYLVHLWDVSCRPCKAEMNVLVKGWLEWNQDPVVQKNVRALFIDEGDLTEDILQFRKSNSPLLGTDKAVLYVNPGQKFLSLFPELLRGSPGHPTTLLIDRCGMIRQAFVGAVLSRDDLLKEAVRRLARATEDLHCASTQAAAPMGSRRAN